MFHLHADHGPHVAPAEAGAVAAAEPGEERPRPGPQLEAALVLDGEHEDAALGDQAQEQRHRVVLRQSAVSCEVT